ncbi:charged multivesicular body protein 2b [Neocloeon triangulifer]|uniref:charged multivesicular body protein 2b n=1 Tax=Neocloeon triangulifer TaxID=2078957 RepID=UPI00286F9FFB|nr:charged multivesicular body protein 2b [Neocloeon triangulifer]
MNFFSKPTLKEEMRENDKALRQVGRSLDRDLNQLDREENKLKADIKKAARDGDKTTCTVLAKQLVQLRKQKQKNLLAKGKVMSVGVHAKTMAANVKVAGALKTTTKTMANMNKVLNPQKIAHDVKEFEKNAMMMGMTDELVNDTLDDILAGSDEEEESDRVVSQVLDEIGIELSGKISRAPAAPAHDLNEKLPSADELEAQLNKLRS